MIGFAAFAVCPAWAALSIPVQMCLQRSEYQAKGVRISHVKSEDNANHGNSNEFFAKVEGAITFLGVERCTLRGPCALRF